MQARATATSQVDDSSSSSSPVGKRRISEVQTSSSDVSIKLLNDVVDDVDKANADAAVTGSDGVEPVAKRARLGASLTRTAAAVNDGHAHKYVVATAPAACPFVDPATGRFVSTEAMGSDEYMTWLMAGDASQAAKLAVLGAYARASPNDIIPALRRLTSQIIGIFNNWAIRAIKDTDATIAEAVCAALATFPLTKASTSLFNGWLPKVLKYFVRKFPNHEQSIKKPAAALLARIDTLPADLPIPRPALGSNYGAPPPGCRRPVINKDLVCKPSRDLSTDSLLSSSSSLLSNNNGAAAAPASRTAASAIPSHVSTSRASSPSESTAGDSPLASPAQGLITRRARPAPPSTGTSPSHSPVGSPTDPLAPGAPRPILKKLTSTRRIRRTVLWRDEHGQQLEQVREFVSDVSELGTGGIHHTAAEARALEVAESKGALGTKLEPQIEFIAPVPWSFVKVHHRGIASADTQRDRRRPPHDTVDFGRASGVHGELSVATPAEPPAFELGSMPRGYDGRVQYATHWETKSADTIAKEIKNPILKTYMQFGRTAMPSYTAPPPTMSFAPGYNGIPTAVSSFAAAAAAVSAAPTTSLPLQAPPQHQQPQVPAAMSLAHMPGLQALLAQVAASLPVSTAGATGSTLATGVSMPQAMAQAPPSAAAAATAAMQLQLLQAFGQRPSQWK
ncbi:hypothetical protein BC828DRAFT_387394 [Blastocladiella britannica]|nr:hypothetical protein BC828DRAFT_387394 [Blastocladiella britannica]